MDRIAEIEQLRQKLSRFVPGRDAMADSARFLSLTERLEVLVDQELAEIEALSRRGQTCPECETFGTAVRAADGAVMCSECGYRPVRQSA